MTIKIRPWHKGPDGKGAPVYFWKNFLEYVRARPWSGKEESDWDKIFDELSKYNCRFEYSHLVFDTEEDMLYFVLRWS